MVRHKEREALVTELRTLAAECGVDKEKVVKHYNVGQPAVLAMVQEALGKNPKRKKKDAINKAHDKYLETFGAGSEERGRKRDQQEQAEVGENAAEEKQDNNETQSHKRVASISFGGSLMVKAIDKTNHTFVMWVILWLFRAGVE